ncbi:MAG: hypothetical protein WED07_15495 [Candidatus Freyarchaeum deiterrae]
MSLISKSRIRDASRAAIVAGVAMFLGFFVYYYFLFTWSYSQLSLFIIVFSRIFPSFPPFVSYGYTLFLANIDNNAVSFATTHMFTVTAYSLLISLPFIFATMILAVGTNMLRKKENVRRFAWILGILDVLAVLTFSLTGMYPTFVNLKPPIFLGLLFLVIISAGGVLIASSAILFPRRSLEKYNREKDSMSWEERTLAQNHPYYPSDTTVTVALLLFVALVILIIIYFGTYAMGG